MAWASEHTRTGTDSYPLHSEEALSSRHSLEQMVSIAGTELLRGVALSKVLRNCGKLFKSNQEVAAVYALSQPIASIDEFLSHNWSVPRGDKFLALALHYRAGPALLAAWSVGATASGLVAAGYLPFFDLGPRHSQSVAAWLTGHFAFFLVFLFAHDLGLPMGSKMVFLDRACIDQMDTARQRKGIENLAGFLNMSHRMVVIYSMVYLKRLWTVYELASFMLLHRDVSRMVILPIYWVQQVACYIMLLFLVTVLYRVAHVGTLQAGLPPFIVQCIYLCTIVVCGVCWTATLRLGHRKAQAEEAQIESFSIRRAVCAVEADRNLVEGNICRFMHALNWVESPDPEVALDKFDEVVRLELPAYLRASLGNRGLPYWMCMTVNMTFMLFAMDNFAAELRIGSAALTVAAKVLHNVLTSLAIQPLSMALAHSICGLRLQWRSLLGEAAICVLAVLPAMLLIGVGYFLASIVVAAENKAPAFVAMLLYSMVMILATWAFFRRQEPEKLADLVRAARTSPEKVLKEKVLEEERDWDDFEEHGEFFTL